MDGYEAQLAAVSEGMCPEHLTALGADGWCGRCGHGGAWWSIDRKMTPGVATVVTRYPDASQWPPPDQCNDPSHGA